jgi:hypothetical protein
MEHPIGDMIQQMTFELKVDYEIDVGLVASRRESPRICQVLQRALDGTHQHLPWSLQGDLAREAFLEWSESDDEVGYDLSLILAVDTRAAAPGDEQGIVLHVGDDREKLVGTIGKRRLLFMARHFTPLPFARDVSDPPRPDAIMTSVAAKKVVDILRRHDETLDARDDLAIGLCPR